MHTCSVCVQLSTIHNWLHICLLCCPLYGRRHLAIPWSIHLFFVHLSVPWHSCLGYRHAGCLQLSHHRSPEMWTLDPSVDMDHLTWIQHCFCHRRTAISGGILSRCPRAIPWLLIYLFVARCYMQSSREYYIAWSEQSYMTNRLSCRSDISMTSQSISDIMPVVGVFPQRTPYQMARMIWDSMIHISVISGTWCVLYTHNCFVVVYSIK